ncbi:MAG: hypothetical protein AAGD25_02610 [Cyanobacteria bacterium P01_F01_bin.150]
MSETSNIAALADQISEDIFSWLKWCHRPLKDTNWECVSIHHEKETHPSDVVFYYDDPYTGKVIYLNTDLKSYKKESITKGALEKSLKSLSMAVECANISKDWQNKFLLSHAGSAEVIGLLFIYNHDGRFDTSLYKHLFKIKLKSLDISEKNKIVILEPQRIMMLFNIVHDLKSLVADQKMTRPENYTFFYPDLVLAKAHGDSWSHAASIEMITGPWLIIKHKATEKNKEGYLIYYMRDGDDIDEYVYFLDALSRFQMLLEDTPIRVRLINSVENSANIFDAAKDKYLSEWGSDITRRRRLDDISMRTISARETSFNLTEIGMRKNE